MTNRSLALVLTALVACAWLSIRAEEEKAEPPAGVALTPKATKLADIQVKPAVPGTLAVTLDATGELVLNGDKVTHVTPRVAGVVVEVLKTVGDRVTEGEPIAVLLSSDLGKARIEFYTAKQTYDLARFDLERQKIVHDNTAKLLDLLRKNPDAGELEKTTLNGSIGENKSKLLTAYAALRLSKSSWDRAQKLKGDSIISQANYDLAAKELETAQAEYRGAFEEISFTHRSRLIQSERALQLAETARRNAERFLHILGVSEKDMADLSMEQDADISRFVLRAPASGTVIEKHMALGEHVKEDADCFVIADLSSVWVDISVYPKHLDTVKAAQTVRIKVSGRNETHVGKVALVNPIVNEKTRTASVRVILDNARGDLRPGLFINAAITLDEVRASVLVPIDAVQTMKGKSVVFVQEQDGRFLPRQVTLGAKTSDVVEIKDGLQVGARVVVKNAFTLRAELEKAAFEAD